MMTRYLHRVGQRCRAPFRRESVEAGVENDFDYHLDQLTAQYAAQGMSPDEARRAAEAAFGSTVRLREECRDQRPTRPAF